MSVHLRRGQCCVVHDCLAPAREHGLCMRHWMGLTASERALLIWESAAHATEPVDVLELWALLPSYDGPQAA